MSNPTEPIWGGPIWSGGESDDISSPSSYRRLDQITRPVRVVRETVFDRYDRRFSVGAALVIAGPVLLLISQFLLKSTGRTGNVDVANKAIGGFFILVTFGFFSMLCGVILIAGAQRK